MTQKIVNDLSSLTTLFIKWNDNFEIISKEQLKQINSLKLGSGGTSPVSLFDFIKTINFKKNDDTKKEILNLFNENI